MISGTSTAANKRFLQWAVRPSTAHRSPFCRALYLTTSNKKLGSGTAHRSPFCRALYLTTSNKKLGCEGNIRSMSHPTRLLIEATYAPF